MTFVTRAQSSRCDRVELRTHAGRHLPGAPRGPRRGPPEPELLAADDAIVRIDATGVCGSDLHIYHGRVQIEPGFTIGHEYVGTVVAAGDAVTSVAVGDRVLGCFQVACGTCYFCRRGHFHKCDGSRTFGHGTALGDLQGTQAELALVPLRQPHAAQDPRGPRPDHALFAGDVMGTGYHAAQAVTPGDIVAVLGLGPVGLCAVQAALVARRRARDRGRQRRGSASRWRARFGAEPVHLTEDDPRAAVKAATEGRGVDVAIDCVGDPRALELAIRLTSQVRHRRRRSASTPSAARSTWASSGSRRCRCAPATPT